MANPAITTQFDLDTTNASPITVNDLIALLNPLLHSQIQGTYIPYVIQHDTPGSDDRDKAWIELDTAGRPISIKIWYDPPGAPPGAWRRIYNGMPGEVRGYTGNPAIDFDSTGIGIIGGFYDGWYICNGLNGTPNLSDRFLLGGHMDNSAPGPGYSGGWRASLTQPDGTKGWYSIGGSFTAPIEQQHLPPFDVILAGKEYKAEADHTPDFVPIVDVHYANLTNHSVNLGHYGTTTGNPKQSLWTVAPFYTLAWIIFRGYT